MSQGGLIDPPPWWFTLWKFELLFFLLFPQKLFIAIFAKKNNKIQIVINNYKQITPENIGIFIKSKYSNLPIY